MGPTVCSSLEDLLLNSVLMRSPPKPAERAPLSPLPMKPVDIFTSLPMLSMQPGSDLMVSPGLRFFVRMGYRRPNLRRRAERQRRRRRGVGNGGGGGGEQRYCHEGAGSRQQRTHRKRVLIFSPCPTSWGARRTGAPRGLGCLGCHH